MEEADDEEIQDDNPFAHAQTLTRAWPQNKNFWTLKQQLQQHSRQ